jgi:xanthine dehydrogenase accessory factor
MLNRRHLTHQPLATPQQVLRFMQNAQASGQDAVLVVLTGTSNGGPRDGGALMAVLDTGERAGSLSSGCVEAAIAAEALEALTDGVSRRVRFGDGSRYIDIRLPCGAGMDLLFVPRPDPDIVRHATAMLDDRRPVTLNLTDDGAISCWEGEPSWSGDQDDLVARYAPELRLIVAGHGAEADALVRQGRAYGAVVELLTPDEDLLEGAIGDGVSARLLEQVDRPPPIAADPWTAIAIMFHDHDWEPALLDAALHTPAFWIGAMGSSRTADHRREMLSKRGLETARIERIKGPIGSIPSARDPSTLALSALADIVAVFGRRRD